MTIRELIENSMFKDGVKLGFTKFVHIRGKIHLADQANILKSIKPKTELGLEVYHLVKDVDFAMLKPEDIRVHARYGEEERDNFIRELRNLVTTDEVARAEYTDGKLYIGYSEEYLTGREKSNEEVQEGLNKLIKSAIDAGFKNISNKKGRQQFQDETGDIDVKVSLNGVVGLGFAHIYEDENVELKEHYVKLDDYELKEGRTLKQVLLDDISPFKHALSQGCTNLEYRAGRVSINSKHDLSNLSFSTSMPFYTEQLLKLLQYTKDENFNFRYDRGRLYRISGDRKLTPKGLRGALRVFDKVTFDGKTVEVNIYDTESSLTGIKRESMRDIGELRSKLLSIVLRNKLLSANSINLSKNKITLEDDTAIVVLEGNAIIVTIK